MRQEIPDKLYYRIGEVEALTGLPSYVLRYWESEFKLLKPKKSDTGQRLYTKRELELISRIKTLLYEERLTLEGAKKRLLTDSRKRNEQLDLGVEEAVYAEVFKRVRGRLLALRSLLRGKEPRGQP